MADLDSYGDIKKLKYYTRLTIGDYKRPGPFDTASLANPQYIFLPLPLELRDETVVRYSNEDLQLAGDILNGNIGSGIGSEALRQSGSLVSSAISGIISGAGSALGSQATGDLVAGAAESALPASKITSAISQYFGIAPNPNPSVAFEGPQLRDISLSWILVPTTAGDSAKIRAVVNTLKRAALPVNSVSKSAAILDYPKLVQVNFYPWDKGSGTSAHGWTGKSIIKMKKCFMSAVTANYNSSNSPAFYHDSEEPVSVQISISFKEIEYFLSSDYDGASSGSGKNPTFESLTEAGLAVANNASSNDTTVNPVAEAAGT